LSIQVLVPAAGLAGSGAINYSQAIGETAVELFGSSGYILTQGFHQPGITFSSVIPQGTGVDVYPNPATDYLYVKMFGDVPRKFRIDIINITGIIVYSVKKDFTTPYYFVEQIDVTRLTLGFYLVRVASDDSIFNRVFKIEKM